MLWLSLFRRSASTPPPKRTEKKVSIRSVNIGLMRLPPLGEVICRYLHLSWRYIPYLVKSDWVCYSSILARVRTLWYHVSIWGCNHSSNSSRHPKNPPRYRLPDTSIRYNPSGKNTLHDASSWAGVSKMNMDLSRSGKYPQARPCSRRIFRVLLQDNPLSSIQYKLKGSPCWTTPTLLNQN